MKKILLLIIVMCAALNAGAATWTQPNYGGIGLTGTGAGQPYTPIIISNQSGTFTVNGSPISNGGIGSGTNFTTSGTTGNVSIVLKASGTGTSLINLSGTGSDLSTTFSFDSSGDTFVQHNITVENNLFYGNGKPLLSWNNLTAWTLNDYNGNIVTDGTFLYSPLNGVKISGSNGLLFPALQGGTNANPFTFSGTVTHSSPLIITGTGAQMYQIFETGTQLGIMGFRTGITYNFNTTGSTLILGGTGNAAGVGIGMTPVNTLDVNGSFGITGTATFLGNVLNSGTEFNPFIVGGTSANSFPTIQSTTGSGTGTALLVRGGSNGATTLLTVDNVGNITQGSGTWTFVSGTGGALNLSGAFTNATATNNRIGSFMNNGSNGNTNLNAAVGASAANFLGLNNGTELLFLPNGSTVYAGLVATTSGFVDVNSGTSGAFGGTFAGLRANSFVYGTGSNTLTGTSILTSGSLIVTGTGGLSASFSGATGLAGSGTGTFVNSGTISVNDGVGTVVVTGATLSISVTSISGTGTVTGAIPDIDGLRFGPPSNLPAGANFGYTISSSNTVVVWVSAALTGTNVLVVPTGTYHIYTGK